VTNNQEPNPVYTNEHSRIVAAMPVRVDPAESSSSRLWRTDVISQHTGVENQTHALTASPKADLCFFHQALRPEVDRVVLAAELFKGGTSPRAVRTEHMVDIYYIARVCRKESRNGSIRPKFADLTHTETCFTGLSVQRTTSNSDHVGHAFIRREHLGCPTIVRKCVVI
jgi:hypothetical protein